MRQIGGICKKQKSYPQIKPQSETNRGYKNPKVRQIGGICETNRGYLQKLRDKSGVFVRQIGGIMRQIGGIKNQQPIVFISFSRFLNFA